MLVAVLSLAACQSIDEQSVTPKEYDGPDQEGWNSRITVTSRGRITALVEYGHMQKFAGKGEVLFDEGVVVDFFNKQGQHTSQLTAERGKLIEATSDVEAADNVYVKSDSGIHLATQTLKWENIRERIVTDDFVTITTANLDTLRGQGFESDSSLRNWTIKKMGGVTKKRIEMPKTIGESQDSLGMPADTTVPVDTSASTISDSTAVASDTLGR